MFEYIIERIPVGNCIVRMTKSENPRQQSQNSKSFNYELFALQKWRATLSRQKNESSLLYTLKTTGFGPMLPYCSEVTSDSELRQGGTQQYNVRELSSNL